MAPVRMSARGRHWLGHMSPSLEASVIGQLVSSSSCFEVQWLEFVTERAPTRHCQQRLARNHFRVAHARIFRV